MIQKLQAASAAVPAQTAKKLLDLAVSWQPDEREPDLSGAKLENRPRLAEVSVPIAGNRIDLDFSCGDVFAGHGLAVTVTAGGRVVSAQLS